jgi:hypothetical protein
MSEFSGLSNFLERIASYLMEIFIALVTALGEVF